jgi:predicted aspartyl protease
METSLFHTHAIVNNTYVFQTLIDSGAQSYASIRKEAATEARVNLLSISPREAEGWIQGPKTTIDQVAQLEIDVGGLGKKRIFAYLVKNQTEDLILGRPWLKEQGATLDEKKDCISFDWTETQLFSDKATAATVWNTCKINQVSASTFGALNKRAKKVKGSLHMFAASIADIEKALKPKAKLSLQEVTQRLPEHYREFSEAFSPEKAATLPPFRAGIDHELPLEKDENNKEKEVPWGPLYNMSRDELLVLRKELTSLLDKDFIEVSKSPAAAPVLFAKKPGGGLRFCVDYRGLNAITKKDRYPLPLIRETLSALSKAKWLTKFDVSAAFHRIRMAKGEEWKTAFRTRYGLYQWKVMPFGLTGAPATFQRYINWVLREYLDDFCSAYVDDILVFSSGSLQDHRNKVKMVLQKLQDADLQLDISKSEFETKEVKYLGYIISVGEGVKIDPEKIKAIVDWVQPKSTKAVRSFLGFANYYRMFIEDYSNIAIPLLNLTKKGMPFTWGDAEEQSFQNMKQKFIKEPVLASYDPDKDTRVEPDSSGWAVGGVLSQFNQDQQVWHPVFFFSAKHLPAECNYDIKEKELLAVIKCLKEWRGELKGLAKPFTILTDHKNLEKFSQKKLLSERQVRWSEFLSEFNFTLQHKPGKDSIPNDVLSRLEQDVPQDATDLRILEREKVLLPNELWIQEPLRMNPTRIQIASPFQDPNLTKLWTTAMDSKDSEIYQEAFQAIQKGERKFPKELNLQVSTGDCDIREQHLRFRQRLWIPAYEPLTTALVQQTHDSFASGHPGRDNTIALLCRQFYWPGMNAQVRQFIRNCDVCGRSTIWRDKKKGLLKPLPVPERIWQEISMDFITDLPQTKENKSIVLLVITDRLSKGTILIEVLPG